VGAHVQFGILGPLEVRHGGLPVPVGGPRQRALLALLLCNANRVVSRDRLVDELLGGQPADSAELLLRVQVSRLRKALAVDGEQPRLIARPPGYLLRVERGELDLPEFERPELREAVSLEDWSAFLQAAPDDGELPLVDPADPSQLQFTSGSTGAPKGALLHHRGILNSARFVAEDLELGRDDVWLACLPLCYIAGCTITVLAALQARATLVLCDFEPGRVLALVEAEHTTVTLLAAAMVQMLLEHEDFSRRELSSMRVVSVGGSAIAPELACQAQAALGVPLTVMYGLTEACGIVTQTRIGDPEDHRIQTIGRPHPHVGIKIIDPWRGDELAPGAAGELLLRGYFVMNGYLDMPEATRETIDADGWLHTGDLATLDHRGYLRITGRLKEIINRGARKIAPGEIEALLNSHPAVAFSGVIAVPDQRLGEEIAAFVRLTPGATTTEQELHRLCAEQLAPYKRPRHWSFLDEMPLTRSGKVHKPTLREIFDARLSPPQQIGQPVAGARS
jgi:fatty-acyl-CoA synthase